jgi:monoamine oxidase
MNQIDQISRRSFLRALAGFGGAVAINQLLGTLASSRVDAKVPIYAPNIGRGKRVIVIGAGVAGICSAYHLAKSGFDVTILEANNRFGGRSFTVRPGDTFQEEGGPKQECKFTPVGKADAPNLYLNAGPGRIPHHHHTVLNYCRELGVDLEPFIFMCSANRLQSKDLNGGNPVLYRQLQNSLQYHMRQMMEGNESRKALNKSLKSNEVEAFWSMLARFGALDDVADHLLRRGYSVEPGAGLNKGTPLPIIKRGEILNPKFWQKDGGFLSGSFFNNVEYLWQNSLLQPVGGMDQLWQKFLVQSVSGDKILKDLIQLGKPVKTIRNIGNKVEVIYTDAMSGEEKREVVDFCISTMAPKLLAQVGRDLSEEFKASLDKFVYTPSCKVGWQTKTRFWEETEDNPIYGGISWVNSPSTQVWYPSSGFNSKSGVLTAAYNRGKTAEAFGNLSLEGRFQSAFDGGEKLHPGLYTQNIRRETALSVAWQKMPYITGGWPLAIAQADVGIEPNDPRYAEAKGKRKAYEDVSSKFYPYGQIYLAGDFLSYLPGWQEGALTSAEMAVDRIIKRVGQGSTKSE